MDPRDVIANLLLRFQEIARMAEGDFENLEEVRAARAYLEKRAYAAEVHAYVAALDACLAGAIDEGELMDAFNRYAEAKASCAERERLRRLTSQASAIDAEIKARMAEKKPNRNRKEG